MVDSKPRDGAVKPTAESKPSRYTQASVKTKTVVMNVIQFCVTLKIPFFRKFLKFSGSAVAVDVLCLRCYFGITSLY